MSRPVVDEEHIRHFMLLSFDHGMNAIKSITTLNGTAKGQHCKEREGKWGRTSRNKKGVLQFSSWKHKCN